MFQQQIDDAIVSLQRALELNPNLSEAHHNLGLCYAVKQSWQDAANCFGEASRINPGLIDAHLGLADSLARLGKPKEARDAVNAALKLRPDDPRAHQILDEHGLRENGE